MRIAAAKAARDTRAAMGVKARIMVVKGLLGVDDAACLVYEADEERGRKTHVLLYEGDVRLAQAKALTSQRPLVGREGEAVELG